MANAPVNGFMLIGDELRLVFFGLECVLNVVLDSAECERVFRDAREDQVSSKEYLFFESPTVTIRGEVGEYEPESIRLTAQGKDVEALQRVIETAKQYAKRFNQSSA